MRMAVLAAVLVHAAAGALVFVRPPAWLARPVPPPPPPHEAEIEMIQNDMPTAGDAPTGGTGKTIAQVDGGRTAAPPPRDAQPQTTPTLSAALPVAADGELGQAPAAPPSPRTAPASPAVQAVAPTPHSVPPDFSDEAPAIRLATSDEQAGVSGGSAEVPAQADPSVRNKLPAYPTEAAHAHQQGEVEMVVHVAPDGSPAAVVVATSSGSPALDTAAVRAVQRWKFRAALDHGAPVDSEVPVNLNFVLK